eukprot:TRINITY_DN11571_c0_g1_i1.p1 TRINITY_DN11571_c0_g1~~TRINITY_DN11571_c0_g1_i1.p1  ORF type:complete len:420 (+),score=58.44 TRINITY_DN11571_c0_g1_i1:57-1262(+)
MTLSGRAVLGGVFEGLSAARPGPEQVLRAPRLNEELCAIQALGFGLHDLRKLEPAVLADRFKQVEEEPTQRSLLALATFVGTAQACLKGSYWAPDCSSGREVDCGHLVRPVSCLHPITRLPAASELKASGEKQVITCMSGCNPIDAALRLEASACRRVAILRCTSLTDPRSQIRKYSNAHEDQLFQRTTYFEAFERLAEDMQVTPNQAIKEGGIIYTSGVGVLRGPLKDGAPWIERPPQIDVMWLGLPAHPELFEQELYASSADRDYVKSALDRALAWAVAHGADAVVMSPPGCLMGGCIHPRLQVAGLIHEAASLHARHLPVVCVASDHPTHCEATWWDDFALGVEQGRPDPKPIIHVPAIPLMMDGLKKKDPHMLLEKRRKQLGAWSAPGSRQVKNSFL